MVINNFIDFLKKLSYNKYIIKNINKEDFVMEDEDKIQLPYYEMVYADDENNKHIAAVKDSNEVFFMQDRFKVLECNYRQ